MSTAEKYIVYGPSDTLLRFGPTLVDETSPKHSYSAETDGLNVTVAVYEDTQKLMNTSTSLTVIFEMSGKSLKIEIVATGGRTGFRGSSADTEVPITETVKDFILDYTKRFGLTIQENKPVEESEEE